MGILEKSSSKKKKKKKIYSYILRSHACLATSTTLKTTRPNTQYNIENTSYIQPRLQHRLWYLFHKSALLFDVATGPILKCQPTVLRKCSGFNRRQKWYDQKTLYQSMRRPGSDRCKKHKRSYLLHEIFNNFPNFTGGLKSEMCNILGKMYVFFLL